MPSSVPMLAVLRYVPRQAGEDHPDVQGRPGCIRLVMAPQPPSAKNLTLLSHVDIPCERDRCYGPPPPKCSDDDGDECLSTEGKCVFSYWMVKVMFLHLWRTLYIECFVVWWCGNRDKWASYYAQAGVGSSEWFVYVLHVDGGATAARSIGRWAWGNKTSPGLYSGVPRWTAHHGKQIFASRVTAGITQGLLLLNWQIAAWLVFN